MMSQKIWIFGQKTLPFGPNNQFFSTLRPHNPLFCSQPDLTQYDHIFPNGVGHAEADDAEVCGLMRICAYAEALRKTKSVCAIVGKKNKVKNRTKLGRRRARAKTVKIPNKNSKKSIKLGQKMGQ